MLELRNKLVEEYNDEIAPQYTKIVGKGAQRIPKSQLSVSIKLEDIIPRGGTQNISVVISDSESNERVDHPIAKALLITPSKKPFLLKEKETNEKGHVISFANKKNQKQVFLN